MVYEIVVRFPISGILDLILWSQIQDQAMSQNLKFGHFCYLSDLVHSLSLFKVILYFVK